MSLLNHFGLAIKVQFVTPKSPCYRPPSWPPPRDWACVVDADGNAVSYYGDSIWRLDAWAGKPSCLNFGDGPRVERTTRIDRKNADLLRLLVTWRGWGGAHGAKTVATLKNNFFTPMRAIVAACSHEGILASDLVRFPAVAAKLPQVLAPSQFSKVISELQRILDARQELGFVLLDQSGIRRLVSLCPEHNKGQTEYIPPRIWNYQVNRLRECLDEYLMHRNQVEACFHFCINAYAENLGSLTAVYTAKTKNAQPFQKHNGTGGVGKYQFHGHFEGIATRFGIFALLGRWVGEPVAGSSSKGISLFSAYLSLVQHAALAYLLNFSLMRHDEGRSLRSDCLYVEEDEKLGKIHILCGETTKTDPDSDARWPTSPSVGIAVNAMRSISSMRMRCAAASPVVAPSVHDTANPFLFDRSFEPWAGNRSKPYQVRPKGCSYGEVISLYPKLFDAEQLKITCDDLKVARFVTPSLNSKAFQVGKPWPLAWHQLRRTGAVNMFGSGTVSDATMQFQMKHLTRAMSLYYGRGHSGLALNEEARALLVNAQYEVMGREIAAVVSDRFVSPYGDEHKKRTIRDLAGFQEDVVIMTEDDANFFEKASRRGAISFRMTVLGACMGKEQCDGDCIESIADCAGGDGCAPCKEALFDRQRAGKNMVLLRNISQQMNATFLGTPRYRALEKEKRGLENYFAYIKQS